MVEQDGEPAAVAFACYRWDDRLEIGIETRPVHRGRGLARLAATAMVRRVGAAGLVPVWSCREDDAGSVRLARSAGFVPVTRAPYFHVPPA